MTNILARENRKARTPLTGAIERPLGGETVIRTRVLSFLRHLETDAFRTGRSAAVPGFGLRMRSVLNLLPELEKAGRVRSKNPRLIGSGESRQLCHHLHRPVVADGEAIITADHDPLCADQANEIEKRAGIVAYRVVGKPLEIS